MYRKFIVEIPKDYKVLQPCGIYKMSLGDRYYIGQSMCMRFRWEQHGYENEILFRNYGDIPLGLPEDHYKYKMFMYMVDHPEVEVMKFEVLKYCKIKNLRTEEQKAFKNCIGDEKCLNRLPSTLLEFEINNLCYNLVKNKS